MIKISPYAIRIIKTCNLYICFMVLGMCYAIVGPTLLDLTHLVSTDISTISFIYVARSIGSLAGSFLAGIIYGKIESKQLILTINSLVTAVSLFGIPWSRQITTLTAWMVLNGISMGATGNGGNVCCLNLWGKDGAAFFQALHFCFGIGGLIAPLIAAPFLGNFSESFDAENSTSFFINQTILQPMPDIEFQNISSTTDYLPTVTYPFAITGVFSVCVAFLFFIMYIVSPIDENNQKNEAITSDGKSKSLKALLVFLTCVLILTSMGTEIGYAQFLTAYSVKGPLHLTKITGSYMTSAYWGAFTAARLVAIFLSIKVSSLSMLIFDIILTTIGSLILLLVAVHHEWALWLSSVILGVGIATFYPSSVTWLAQYINITNQISSMFSIGFAVGTTIIPYCISYYIEEKPEVFVYITVLSCPIGIIATGLMYTVLRRVKVKSTVKEEVTAEEEVKKAKVTIEEEVTKEKETDKEEVTA